MKTVLKGIFDFMRQHKGTTLFYVFFAVFWSFTLPYMSYLFGHIVDEVKSHSAQNMSIFKLVTPPLLLYISIHVLRSFGYYTSGLLSLLSIPAYKKIMVKRLFNHLSQQPIDYYETKKSGALSNKVTNACIGLEPIITNVFNCIFPQSLAILITGIMLSMVVPYFGFIFWLWGISLILYTYKSAKKGEQNSANFASACSTFNGHMLDYITNIQSVIFNASFTKENTLIENNMANLIEKERIRNRHANKVLLIQHLAMNAMVGFFLVGSVMGYQNHLVSLGEMVFVMTSVMAIGGLTSGLGNAFLQLMYNIGLLKEGLSLLEDEVKVNDKEHSKKQKISQGEIAFKKSGFIYPNGQLVFQDFNLNIKAKEKVGIVGKSGEGKSTLLKLILRLYELNSGQVLIDNQDIKRYKNYDLRSQISLVPQQINLFHRSIIDNISYGCAEKGKDEIVQAAKNAKCHEFIEKLPLGYDTLVGEQGVKLSGGQRQRLMIARAILKDAPILLLDEATSSLDSETEENIQQALNALIKDKTVIAVAHRLSTLKMMDRIVVLEKGKVIEEGPHEELLDKKGAYYHFWKHQSEKNK